MSHPISRNNTTTTTKQAIVKPVISIANAGRSLGHIHCTVVTLVRS